MTGVKKRVATSVGSRRDREPRHIHFDEHVPTLVGILANRLRRAASGYYRRHYGIGIVEWRVMMLLGRRPDLSANQIGVETDLDKGAVSRSLGVLRRKRLISIVRKHRSSRQGLIMLTEKGRYLHRLIVVDARKRQDRLLAGMTPEQIGMFLGILRQLVARVPHRRSGADQSPER